MTSPLVGSLSVIVGSLSVIVGSLSVIVGSLSVIISSYFRLQVVQWITVSLQAATHLITALTSSLSARLRVVSTSASHSPESLCQTHLR